MEFKVSITECTGELGILPRLKVRTNVSIRDPNNQSNPVLLIVTAKLKYNGYTISSADPILCNDSIGNGQLSRFSEFYFTLERDKLSAIENIRDDDIRFDVVIEFLYSFVKTTPANQTSFGCEPTYSQLKLSQREWNQILHVLGFNSSWIFEIPRPDIEGFTIVIQHIEKATAAFYIKSYDDCIGNIRVAWNSLKPLLDSKWSELAQFIDSGSPGQAGHDAKSKRVSDMKDRIIYFSQIGVHREFYKLNPEDAILSYYESIALISYLGQLLKLISLNKS